MKKTLSILGVIFVVFMSILFSITVSNTDKANGAVAVPPFGYDLYDYDLDVSDLKTYYGMNTGSGFNDQPLNVAGYDTNYIYLNCNLIELDYNSNNLLGFSFNSTNKPLFATLRVTKMDNSFISYDVSLFVGQESVQYKTYALATSMTKDIDTALYVDIYILFDDIVLHNTIHNPLLNSDGRTLSALQKMNIINTYSVKYWSDISVNLSENLAYITGYDNGYNEGNIIGYNNGLNIGNDLGYQNGYNEGYLIGINETLDDLGITAFIPNILGSYVNFLFILGDFKILGISILDVILIFATLAIGKLLFKMLI